MSYAPAQPPPVQFVKAPSNGLATASLVLGILGVVFALVPILGVFGAVLGGIGFILAIFGFLAGRKHGVGKGKAIAGLVLGAASVVVFLIVSAATVAAVDSAVKDANKEISDRNDTSAATDVSDAGELKDAKLGAVAKDGFGSVTAKVTLTNNSSKPSDYTGSVVFESKDGKRQFGTGALFVEGLKPGQTKVENVMLLDELPAGTTTVVARLTDFDRTASY